MVNLFCDPAALAESLTATPPLLTWQDPAAVPPSIPDPTAGDAWSDVTGLEDQQKRCLQRLHARGVFWKNGTGPGVAFRLSHGGDVDSDGNCLFTASRRAMGAKEDARDLRRKTVARFLEDYGSRDVDGKAEIDGVVRHLYAPDLAVGWGIHVVQELKLLVKKSDREGLDAAIQELVDLGISRDNAAESIYKERCLEISDGESWAKYMSVSGSSGDEYDIVTLQYTEEGLLSVDENRGGHAAAFGDDIAIESLATEFKREIFVVQAHGSDAMVDEDNCIFFLPHQPRGQICGPPAFLFMKGTGWCGAGADHYEPLIAHPIPHVSQEKTALIL